MKVYVVEAFTAEPYEDYRWIHAIYSSRDKALASLPQNEYQVFNEDNQNYEYGYRISGNIQEVELQ